MITWRSFELWNDDEQGRGWPAAMSPAKLYPSPWVCGLYPNPRISLSKSRSLAASYQYWCFLSNSNWYIPPWTPPPFSPYQGLFWEFSSFLQRVQVAGFQSNRWDTLKQHEAFTGWHWKHDQGCTQGMGLFWFPRPQRVPSPLPPLERKIAPSPFDKNLSTPLEQDQERAYIFC